MGGIVILTGDTPAKTNPADEPAATVLRRPYRQLQTTVNAQHLAMIFERSMELLTQVQPRVFPKLNPVKVVELFRLGGDGGTGVPPVKEHGHTGKMPVPRWAFGAVTS